MLKHRPFLYLITLAMASLCACSSSVSNPADSESQTEIQLPQTSGDTAQPAFALSLRSKPSSVEGSVIAQINAGSTVDIVSSDDSWTQVIYNDTTGYVYTSLLAASIEEGAANNADVEDPSASSATSATTPVHMLSQEELDYISATYDATSKGFGASTGARDSENRHQGALDLEEQLSQFGATFFGDKTSPIIYLSFSSGWENAPNSTILLDVLAQQNVKAVFYLTYDYANRNADLVWRMINEGHQIGNHGYTHPDNGMPSLSLQAQMEDAMAMQQFMIDTFGYTMTKYNFSSSEWSEQSVALMTQMGYQVCFYSCNYADYDVSQPKEGSEVLEMLTNALSPGCIYYLHPVSTGNIAAMSDFIVNARSAGYTFGSF